MELKWIDTESLRRFAEASLTDQALRSDSGAAREALLHELSVQDAVLRLQHEALLEAERELGIAKRRYEDLFNHCPMGYASLDEQSRITNANERAARLLTSTAGAVVLGQRLSTFIAADEAPCFERYRRAVLASPDGWTAEFTVDGDDGKKEVRFEGACTDRRLGHWRVALTDVTAYNRLSRRLDHDLRLAVIEHHASGVAHDLKNLLYGILGHADAALRSLEPGTLASDAVLRLREVVHRCGQATEQLATFSRAEDDSPAIVELNTVIARNESLLRSMLGDDIQLELRLAASDAAIRFETAQVEQILLTTVRNSIQSMPHGGAFRIETTSVELTPSSAARRTAKTRFVRWNISDTGVGMNEATRRRAFEAFFTTKPAGLGTGLGLALVKSAVERANGFVDLESALGRGTSVVIHLPCATGTSEFPPPPSER
jgi:hypothetical protein